MQIEQSQIVKIAHDHMAVRGAMTDNNLVHVTEETLF